MGNSISRLNLLAKEAYELLFHKKAQTEPVSASADQSPTDTAESMEEINIAALQPLLHKL